MIDEKLILSYIDKFLDNPENKKALNNNDFDFIYRKLKASLNFNNFEIVSYFTKLILSIGFEPLMNLDYIPDYYMFKNNDIETFNVPENIVKIYSSAFCYCSKLVHVTLPSSLTYIGFQAFQGCHIRNIKFPKHLDIIGYGAFDTCIYLESIDIPGSVNKIMPNSFNSCIALTKAVFNEGTEFINNAALSHCSSLKEVYLPKSLKYINLSAFNDSINLHDIYYAGTSEDFGQLDFGIDYGINSSDMKIKWKGITIHCSNKDINL